MNKILFRIIVLAALAMLLITGCGPAPTPEVIEVEVEKEVVITQVVEVEGETVVEEVVITATPEPEPEMGPFRVAVILPSSIDDAAFSQAMYAALLSIQAEWGGEDKFEIAYSEGMFKVPDASAAIRDYASEGFDLVIVHGAVIGTALPQIAPDFPETSFAWGSGIDTFQSQGVENVFAYEVRAQEGGYVLGTMGALLSESGVLGVNGPIATGDAKLYVDGFVVGAMAARPDATVNVSYTGSFADVSLMAAAAETHIQAGADVITGTSQSAVGAIGVAKDNGAVYLCQQWDQIVLAPEAVPACQIYDFTGVVNDIIETRLAGVMGGKVYNMSFKNGGLTMLYNEGYPLPDDVQAAVDAAIQGIEDGTIDPLAPAE